MGILYATEIAMKKKRLAAFILFAPLCLLAACGGGGPSTDVVNYYWYKNTETDTMGNTNEKLEYDVTFISPTDKGDYFVTYNPGTYTTELTTVDYPFENGSDTVYCYKTRLDISGYYTLVQADGEPVTGETFTDFVETTSYFHGAKARHLLPIKSEKTIHSTNPVNAPTAETMSELIHISYTVEYSTAKSGSYALDALTGATVTRVNHITGATSEPVEMNIDYNGNYFDNEQILFALRGFDLSSSLSFGTNNPQTDEVVTVSFTEAPSEVPYPGGFTVDGEPSEESIAAYRVQFRYNMTNSGTPRTAIYAKKTSSNNNVYRNVMLRLEDPLSDGYGTLRYSLKSIVSSR